MPSPSLTHAAVVVSTFLLTAVGCERIEPEAPQPRTNREIYESFRLEQPELTKDEEELAIQAMWRVWGKHGPVFRSHFLGIPTAQNPTDAWIVQEIISEVEPDLIVEAGTYRGGSAVLWAMLLEHVNPEGRVVTIDIEDQRVPRAKELPISRERVEFLLGSSTDPEIVAEVHRRAQGKRVLVILDSLHTAEHVAAELEAYAPLVPVGSYVIVQDTPVGPIHAIEPFLAAHPGWQIDRERERFFLTNTVNGYLHRVR